MKGKNLQSITLEIPVLPDRALSPNWRGHWSIKNKASQELRFIAWVVAKESKCPHFEKATVQFTYHVQTNRRRDGDNWLIMAKPLIDGLVDAGIFPDDSSRFIKLLPVKFELGKSPKTVVEILSNMEPKIKEVINDHRQSNQNIGRPA